MVVKPADQKDPLDDPKPPVDGADEPVDVVVDDAPADGADVVVDLDDAEAEDKDLKTPLDNKAFARMRKEAADARRALAESNKRIADLEAQTKRPVAAAPQVPQVPSGFATKQRELYSGVPIPESREEWDALASKDWKLAMDMNGYIQSRKALQQYEQQREHSVRLADAKQVVLKKHPELEDAMSEKSQIYMRVLDRNPEYINHPRGPVFAMRDMEEELEALGASKTTRPSFDDAARVTRAALTSGGRMPAKPGRTVTMSKADIEFCETQEIDKVEYARQKLAQETRQRGVQL